MTTERVPVRRKPPARLAPIRSLILERGELDRADLREWAEGRGLIAEGERGWRDLKTVLFRLRAAGLVDYSPTRVWAGRNPAKARNLSSEIGSAREKFSAESKRLISELILSLRCSRGNYGQGKNYGEALAF